MSGRAVLGNSVPATVVSAPLERVAFTQHAGAISPLRFPLAPRPRASNEWIHTFRSRRGPALRVQIKRSPEMKRNGIKSRKIQIKTRMHSDAAAAGAVRVALRISLAFIMNTKNGRKMKLYTFG